jgi:anti-anti-sigma factor
MVLALKPQHETVTGNMEVASTFRDQKSTSAKRNDVKLAGQPQNEQFSSWPRKGKWNMSTERKAMVVELPERLTLGQIQAFLLRSNALLKADRPRLVFDFSHVREVDSAGVEMLVRCMEQVTKQDGDLKLAAVPVEVAIVLELTCIDRLFEIFAVSTEAVESFNTFSVEAVQRGLGMPHRGSSDSSRSDGLPMAS